MKKIKIYIVGLAITALAAVFAISHTTSTERALLKANIEALANDPNNPSILDDGWLPVMVCIKNNGTGELVYAHFCDNGCSSKSWGKKGGDGGNC